MSKEAKGATADSAILSVSIDAVGVHTVPAFLVSKFCTSSSIRQSWLKWFLADIIANNAEGRAAPIRRLLALPPSHGRLQGRRKPRRRSRSRSWRP